MQKGWQTVRLGQVVTTRSEFIRIDDMRTYKRCRVQLGAKGVVLRDEVEGAFVKTKTQQVCRAEELLVAEIDAKVGGFGMVPHELEGSIVSSHYFLFAIDRLQLDPRFLGYFVKTPAFMEQIKARGSTNYASIRAQQVLDYMIPIPPLDEQQRIVARIERFAGKIEEAMKLRESSVNETEMCLETAIETSFNASSEKRVVRLGEITTKIGSGSTPTGGHSVYGTEGIPFIRSMNVRMRYFSWTNMAYIDTSIHEKMSSTRVRPLDVLFNITGASIGRVAIAPTNLPEGNVNQHVAIIRPSNQVIPEYLMYWLSRPSVQALVNNEQKGATRQGFTKQQLEQLKITIPPLPEQKLIVAYLDNLKAKVDQLNVLQAQSATEIEALLPAVLTKAFREEL